MPTQVLYMEDRRGQEPDPCYLREFDATVLERGPDFVVLDRTGFYAEGGGQPYDTGSLSWSGGEAKVLRVTKEKGVIRHHVDRLPPEGAVRGIIDWDRRYAHMRYHTSQHLLSGLVWKIYAARTVGNQLYTDRARVDFQPASFTRRISLGSRPRAIGRLKPPTKFASFRKTGWSSTRRSETAPSWI